jgi:gas vesicle protein
MASNDDGASFVMGFLVGGIVGAIAGILMAPKTGSETRATIIEQSETLRDRAEELAARVRERAGPTVDNVRERMAPAVEGVREKVSPVVERVSSAVRSADGDAAPVADEPTDEPASGNQTASGKAKA